MLGATNEDLVGFFAVTRRTVDNWIATHPDFAKAVHQLFAVQWGPLAALRCGAASGGRRCGSNAAPRSLQQRRGAAGGQNAATTCVPNLSL